MSEFKTVTSIREKLDRKLNNLSLEQLNSVCRFVESIEQEPSLNTESLPKLASNPEEYEHLNNLPETNEDIDRVVESLRKQNKLRPIGLAEGQFTVPDDFNDPLPDEILDLFNNPQ